MGPLERVLLRQKEPKKVLEIRDLMMDELAREIRLDFWKVAQFDIKEVYADWNLDNQTGMFLLVLNQETDEKALEWLEGIDREAVREEIIKASIKEQKKPNSTNLYWISSRVILIERPGIFVEVEKKLIKNGFAEALKIAKRPLEYRLFPRQDIENILKRNITEMYVDWHFEGNKGYMAVVLEPERKSNRETKNITPGAD